MIEEHTHELIITIDTGNCKIVVPFNKWGLKACHAFLNALAEIAEILEPED